MAGKVEARLRELGIELPNAMEPKIAKILTAKIGGGFLFVSGQITQWNGELRYVGKVGRDFDLASGQAAARLSALNVLAQAKKALGGDLDRIREVTRLKGYVNVDPNFTQISEVMNGASEVFNALFGEAGRHARTAIGVASMPLGVAIEVEAIFLLEPAKPEKAARRTKPAKRAKAVGRAKAAVRARGSRGSTRPRARAAARGRKSHR
jgi:enamine deaminase RidA (YjgF/YER057c/UK114 family)